MPRYSLEDENYLIDVIETSKKLGYRNLPKGTMVEVTNHFGGKFTKGALHVKLCELRRCLAEITTEEIPANTVEITKFTTESATTKEENFENIPTGINKICRLAKEIERLSTEVNKVLKDFKEEYNDNMDMLRKMGELRKAAENVSRKIVKGG